MDLLDKCKCERSVFQAYSLLGCSFSRCPQVARRLEKASVNEV